jgi:hypothetical protein
MSAQEVVALLNELVTGFDEMTEKYGMSAIAALSYGYGFSCVICNLGGSWEIQRLRLKPLHLGGKLL